MKDGNIYSTQFITPMPISERESLTVEFKNDRKRLPDTKLVEAVVCLANTAGGELWLCVEDDGTPTGLHLDHRATLRDELRYILDPTGILGEDCPSETFRVLNNKELKEFGEHITQRLALEAWDKSEIGDFH